MWLLILAQKRVQEKKQQQAPEMHQFYSKRYSLGCLLGDLLKCCCQQQIVVEVNTEVGGTFD
jgi:hypothetical protein